MCFSYNLTKSLALILIPQSMEIKVHFVKRFRLFVFRLLNRHARPSQIIIEDIQVV